MFQQSSQTKGVYLTMGGRTCFLPFDGIRSHQVIVICQACGTAGFTRQGADDCPDSNVWIWGRGQKLSQCFQFPLQYVMVGNTRFLPGLVKGMFWRSCWKLICQQQSIPHILVPYFHTSKTIHLEMPLYLPCRVSLIYPSAASYRYSRKPISMNHYLQILHQPPDYLL